MSAHLEEAIEPELEGSLTGPANPIPDQSIDCGCKQLPCPKLARFATRQLLVGLLSWVGLVQAAAHAYLHIAAPTIARRYQFDPYLMEWVLAISDLTPFVLGILVAYWGDRIHRAAWIGAVVLLQSVSYFVMIIPHLTHQTKVVEETENFTHLSIYADDSRELCNVASSRIVSTENEACYFTLAVMIIMQIISGIANIVYFALGISYLDDNTKKKHVAPFIGVLIAVKILGVLLGFILAWACLRIDAVDLTPIESYREQIGAWWLGLPILTILLIIPGLLLSWFPQMLLSEAVEQGAASLLNGSSNYDQSFLSDISSKVGDDSFWSSLARLVTNKTLICQVLACTLYITAIMNFMAFENLIAESRFHVPKPTGMLRGLDDPSLSRLIMNILKPILIGLIVIISGLVITKARPTARNIIGYSAVVTFMACGIIFALSAARCANDPIIGVRKNSLVLLQYCNKDCGCSNDADFRPVCDSGGKYTFYSACHAGCTVSDVKNSVTIYSGCNCVRELTGMDDDEAVDGSCNSSNCQLSWLAFEFGVLLTYLLIGSTLVGDVLVILRSVNAQDKAIGIGFWMTFVALVMNVPGKIIYDVIASLTCQYWGIQKVMCRLHDGLHLGNYLCYLTGSLLALCVLLRALVWFFCEDLNLYAEREAKTRTGVEMQDLIHNPAAVPLQQTPQTNDDQNDETSVQVEVTNEAGRNQVGASNEHPADESDLNATEDAPLKYGPLGPGNRRTDSKSSLSQGSTVRTIGNLDSAAQGWISSSDEDSKKDSSPKVAYRPLDIESDVESDLSNMEPRSRRRVSSREYDPMFSIEGRSPFRREFPNPDNYDDPRLSRRWTDSSQSPQNPQSPQVDGSSQTDSFQFSKTRDDDAFQKKGDFNEVGIPLVNPAQSLTRGPKPQIAPKPVNGKQRAGRPMVPRRVSSITQNSSSSDSRPESRESVRSPQSASKGSLGTLQTDF